MATTAVQFDPQGARVDRSMDYPLPFDPDSYATGAGGAAKNVEFPADSLRPLAISQVVFGYAAAPTAGLLTITQTIGVTTTTLFSMPVTAAGIFVLDFRPPRTTTASGASLKVELADGGQTKYLWANVYKLL